MADTYQTHSFNNLQHRKHSLVALSRLVEAAFTTTQNGLNTNDLLRKVQLKLQDKVNNDEEYHFVG